jgi:hypothetical protein
MANSLKLNFVDLYTTSRDVVEHRADNDYYQQLYTYRVAAAEKLFAEIVDRFDRDNCSLDVELYGINSRYAFDYLRLQLEMAGYTVTVDSTKRLQFPSRTITCVGQAETTHFSVTCPPPQHVAGDGGAAAVLLTE